VTFLGWRDDVESILRAAHLMVHLPRAEGFGLSVMEALGCGVPVVAADIGGLRDVVAGRVGSLVDPDDWENILYAIRRWFKDDAARQGAATLGPTIAASYDVDSLVTATLSVYASALATPGHTVPSVPSLPSVAA
jgi:glycosyltransferase involved in cell wall biosynthesis